MSERTSSEETEIARIVAAYGKRDASGPSHEYAWANPTFVAYMHRLECEVLRALRDGGVELARACVLDVGCGPATCSTGSRSMERPSFTASISWMPA